MSDGERSAWRGNRADGVPTPDAEGPSEGVVPTVEYQFLRWRRIRAITSGRPERSFAAASSRTEPHRTIHARKRCWSVGVLPQEGTCGGRAVSSRVRLLRVIEPPHVSAGVSP